MPTKILMVCLGNICRSPLAEGIMLKLIEDKALDLVVDSAGTSNYHVGEAPDKRSTANAARHGVDLSPLRARQFKTADFDAFDKIYVMDHSNRQNVLKLARHEADKAKVDLLLNSAFPGEDREVPDPYFGGEQGFEEVFNLVNKACRAIAASLA
ncbi:MAG: low molecular weight phosphotyrosine protein phosphatase [Bacteroidetes bacterium]|nr:low molecular weight phosphotyrosine protein phosphatase [Bacteroidota bacterium]